MNVLVSTILVTALTFKDAASFSFPDEPIKNCVPNSHFFYDHNLCKCNSKGTEIICDRDVYSSVTPTFHDMQLQNLTMECFPNRLFEFRCRECLCDDSGKHATCVQKHCSDSDKALDKPERCIPGSVFNKKCNGCICGADGKAACTRLGCIPQETEKPTCVPNSEFAFECNSCFCTESGESACTRMGCSPDSFDFEHEHVLNVTMSCEAKRIFDYNCHKCVCGDDGSYAVCSGKECSSYDNKKDTKEKCNPGIIFGDDCNVCVCGDDGKGVCTNFSCDTKYRFEYQK